jgi:hypothetical protein
MTELRSREFTAAVTEIERRAERVYEFRKLNDIFVENGVLQTLSINSNQLLLGRRGVGKTHLVRFFEGFVTEKKEEHCLFQFHDCQRLGSGPASLHPNPQTVAAIMFTQLLQDIATAGFEALYSIDAGSQANETKAGDAILQFMETIGRDTSGPVFDFRNLGDTLDKYREWMTAHRLIIILDEWVAIPQGAQPYFAEYLKRAFFVKPRICFKICSVTYQTMMTMMLSGGVIGLERGADVFGDIDMDSYFVWDEDSENVERFFAQVLYNHLAPGIDQWPLHASAEAKIETLTKCFTQREAFVELCRAAEGNCRDLLNIFRLAYFEFTRDTKASRISIANVKAAARSWYQQDKLRNIAGDENTNNFLHFLVQDIIRDRKSKTFMVDYRDVDHPVLTRLFSARLLHPTKITWSHPDKPGEPFRLVTMDFGCYLDLRGTRAEPYQAVLWDLQGAIPSDVDDLVPFNDRRSIHRIILTRADLDKFR